MKNHLSGFALVCAALFAGACRAETVAVYTSANFAPLMVKGGGGIYPDLIAYLNRKRPGDYTFKLVYLPRKRLQVKLEEGSLDGIVVGMMPQWLNDTAQKKYLWTAPFALDRFALVSSTAKPVDADAPASLKDLVIGMTLGYVYPGVDDWVRRHGLIRNDAPSEENNLHKLLRNRVDCAVVAESTARYFIRKNQLYQQFKVVPVAGQVTERRFLVPHSQRAVFDKLAPPIGRLKDDAEWQRALSKYE